jgi:integrase/recombinase XerD
LEANGDLFTVPARNIYRGSAPVEYAVAVERYLTAARLSDTSRRVYRVALQTWAWPLVNRTPPTGPERRGAAIPTLLLSRLDTATATETVRRAMEHRALMVDARTFAREASILRNALHWWAARAWISPDAELTIKAYLGETRAEADAVYADDADDADDATSSTLDPPALDPPALDLPPLSAVFALRAPLREQALWRLVYESAAPIGHLLALDASDLDFATRRVRRRGGPRQVDRIGWGPLSAELLPLLTIGRTGGPVFLTTRRAAGRVPAADRCPYTGRARLSARRAAELFQAATRGLDPAGHGWNLRDLRVAGRAASAGRRW